MREVGLVAAGDDHGRAVAFPNIGQREDDVALPAAKHAMVVVVGPTQRALEAARVNRVVTASAAHRQHTLVDEQSRDIRLLLAAVAPNIVDPAGVVDQALEWLAALDTVVQL